MIIQPSESNTKYLFDEIWPLMEGSQGHLARMIGKQNSITRAFEEFGNDPSQLLRALDAMPDVGLVIASGLIFSANPDDFVPFDQYTMGWAISENIVPDNYISKGCNYVEYSAAIKEYVKNRSDLDSILDFVREASQKGQFGIAPE